jgi:hypothetical protein
MPKWSVFIIVLVLVVGYYLLTVQARQRRRERVGADFAKLPNFYANQTYTDVGGDVAIGIDDRGRRIAVARKHAQPRTRVYSFAHILSAEVVQDDKVIAAIARDDQKPTIRTPDVPADAADPLLGLFGSTRTPGRPGITGLPQVQPTLGQLSKVAVRVRLQNGSTEDEALLRFYEGKTVNADGVVGERAFAEAKVLLGSLDIAMKRAGTPPKGPSAPKTPVR